MCGVAAEASLASEDEEDEENDMTGPLSKSVTAVDSDSYRSAAWRFRKLSKTNTDSKAFKHTVFKTKTL